MKTFVIAAALAGLAWTAQADRLKNGGFESGDLSSWPSSGEGWRCSSWHKDSSRGIYGAVNDVFTNAADEFRVIHQEIRASPGKAYQAGVWLRVVCHEPGTEAFLEVQFMDKGNAVLQQFQSAHVTDNQEFQMTAIDRMIAPDNTDHVSVRGVVHLMTQPTRTTTFFIFDNFDFKPIVGPGASPGK